MSDISNQLIKDSYDYVLQSDLATGIVYRIGGNIAINPIFASGLTVNGAFKYSDGSESIGYVLTSDGSGNATWKPVSAATPSSGVTSITVGTGLSADSTTGAVTIVYTGQTSFPYLPLSGGTVTGDTIFQSGLTANTISATTYLNVNAVTGGSYSNGIITLSGTGNVNGIQITGLSSLSATTLYSGDGTLSGNRLVNLSSYTLIFSSSTNPNNLILSGGSVSVGVSSPSPSALLELSSTTKGFLGPRMTESQRLSMSAVTGLVVYQTDGDEGYYIYKSFGWVQII